MLRTKFLIGFIIIILLAHLIFHPTTKLFGGMGIDGMWYNKIITEQNYKPNDYYIYKSLPSYMLNSIYELFSISKNNNNVIYGFKTLNTFSILISLFLFLKIAVHKKLDDKNTFIFIFLSFISFIILKISFYDVITPDYFGFLNSSLLFYSIITKKNSIITLMLLISLFTNPTIYLIFLTILIFQNCKSQEPNFIYIRRIPVFLSIIFGLSILFWSLIMIIPMHKAGMELTKWSLPDEIDIRVFPLSAILVSLLCGFLSYPIFKEAINYLSIKNLFKIQIKWVIIFFFLMIIKKIVISFNDSPTDLDDPGHLLFMWPLYFCMKPLAGVSEHIHSIGLLIPVVILCWSRIVRKTSEEFGLGGILFLSLFILFIIKPEARHTLPFIPFIGYLATLTLHKELLTKKGLYTLLMLGILLSKIYYPIHYASYGSVDFQDFPPQHYLMFYGFSTNLTMYLVQLCTGIITFYYIYRLQKINKLNPQYLPN